MSEAIIDLLAARKFARVCLLPPDYHFPTELELGIGLTAAGERWRDELLATTSNLTSADASATLLAAYAAGDELLIDPSSSSVETIMRVLGAEIRERRINYPFVFGRELDDKFVDNFGSVPIRAMSPQQTQRIVQLTPQGVFQLHQWVTGPFGLIRSLGRRHLPPQTCGPTIRCSEVSCGRLHHIDMQTSQTACADAYMKLVKSAPVAVGLSKHLTDIEIPDNEFYRANHPGGLPWLLGNGFTHSELVRLVEQVLASNHGGLRERVNNLLGGSASKMPPGGIAHLLNFAQIIQLLLLLDDSMLAEAIEEAINQGVVPLAPTEVRRSFENRHLSSGNYRTDAEASALGVRFIPSTQSYAHSRTLALIKSVFSGEHERELSWQLRNEIGNDSIEKLERSLFEAEPHDLVRKLLFSSRESIERAFDALQFGQFEVPNTQEAETALVEKILWKLGHPLPVPKPAQNPVNQHATALIYAVHGEYATEEARTVAIRSAGMNLFVELEELLRTASEFACWALLNDHYDLHPMNRFRYSPKRAAEFARKEYKDAADERGAAFPYDASGKNALSVLISSFRILAEICESRAECELNFLRPDWHFPAYAKHSEVQDFPLRHTALILDLRADRAQRLIDTLKAVTLNLTRTDICETRNSLGHSRERFPMNEQLLESVEAIRVAVDALNAEGLLPNIRQYAGETQDKFNRRWVRLADGSGDEVLVASPNQVMSLGFPPYNVPQIVTQGAVLFGTLQPVRFAVMSDSEWAELWRNVGLIDSWLNPEEPQIPSPRSGLDAPAVEVIDAPRDTIAGHELLRDLHLDDLIVWRIER
ncbi:hypothetical protein AB0C50_16780 [Micromonospora taraxaci]|uniref:hypothetical protein n=1 Tax=Micromonospora taraxaci TaxID=1316803 RepID=UPI0033DBC264